jgi:hypothetical protein
MFMSSMFGDAIGRDVLPPHAFPQPEEEAPAKYVSVFLRAVGALGAGDAVPLRSALDTNGRRAAAQ